MVKFDFSRAGKHSWRLIMVNMLAKVMGLEMRKLMVCTAVAGTMLLAMNGTANACGIFDFSCNSAKNKAEKTQAVIAVMDAGRKVGWENVGNQFSAQELARLRSIGIDPGNGNLVRALEGVNDDSFGDMKEDEWQGVVDLIGDPGYVDTAIAKSKLGVDNLERMQSKLHEMKEIAAAEGIELSGEDTELLQKISAEREVLMQKIGDLDSGTELQVLSGALRSSARTLDAAGIALAADVMDGGDFDVMVANASKAAGISADQARAVLQEAVSFGVSEFAHQSLTATDAIAEAGHAAAAEGDYASALAADAAARSQAATDRAAEAAALQAAGLTAEAEKVAQIAEAEAAHAAEAAATAANHAAQEAADKAAHAAQKAQEAAIIAASQAQAAADKAAFIAAALAENVSPEEAERLAKEAGH